VGTQRNDDLAVSGFGNGPLYNSARPNYPTEAIEYFVSILGIDRTMHVLDLGAGTGIFSRQILPFVGKLTAVDPSESMRESLRSSTPGVEVLKGSDVFIPLEDGSVDAAFVAQAFHWFDAERALDEIFRVLTASGGLGLIWNERDESVGWVAEMSRAMQWDKKQPYKVGTDFTGVIGAGPFTNVEWVKFRHSQMLTREGLYQRVRTTSYISIMENGPREMLMKDVAKVVEQLLEPIVLPYVTDVYSARADSTSFKRR
jgi:ubiquinone/menaquinone biosynthesis C-methylase UbiE